jgi:hypothetical protein
MSRQTKTLAALRHVVTFQNAAGDHRGKLELDDSNIADFTDCFTTYNREFCSYRRQALSQLKGKGSLFQRQFYY